MWVWGIKLRSVYSWGVHFLPEPALWPSSPIVLTRTSSYVFTQEITRNKFPAATTALLMLARLHLLHSYFGVSVLSREAHCLPKCVESCPDVQMSILFGSEELEWNSRLSTVCLFRKGQWKEAVDIYLSFDKCMASEAHCVFILWTHQIALLGNDQGEFK